MSDSSTVTAIPARATSLNYLVVSAVLGATAVWLMRCTAATPIALQPGALVPPIAAMLALIALVWVAMALTRNLLVALGKVSMRYYHSLALDLPDEALERPARTFNNLMQLPMLFLAVCLLSIALGRVNAITVELAWGYVTLRAIHAVVLIGWNYVPYRFATYAASTLALGTLAAHVVRLAWPGA